jgi:hypothetical protein
MDIVNAKTMDAYEKAIDRLEVELKQQADEIERLREALIEIEWQLKNELYDAAYDTALYTLWPSLQQKDSE